MFGKKRRVIRRRVRKATKLEWENARDIKEEIEHLVESLPFEHIDTKRIFSYRSYGSSSRSYARIWAFPKIFQDALRIKPAYVVEVLSKYFDKLSDDEKKKVLIHELLHIPKNFSGALQRFLFSFFAKNTVHPILFDEQQLQK